LTDWKVSASAPGERRPPPRLILSGSEFRSPRSRARIRITS